MKVDIEALFIIRLLNLKESKLKKYSSVESKHNIVYVFENEEDYKYYFIDNGFNNVSENILNSCKIKTTKKGRVIAYKGLCDHAITRHREINSKFNQCEIKLDNATDVLKDLEEEKNSDEIIISEDEEKRFNLINRNKLKILTTNFRDVD